METKTLLFLMYFGISYAEHHEESGLKLNETKGEIDWACEQVIFISN